MNWLAGWYATKLHAIETIPDGISNGRSICGAFVYRYPRTLWAKKRFDKGLPHCKHCERMLIRERKDSESKR